MSNSPDLSSLLGMLNNKNVNLNNLMQNFSSNDNDNIPNLDTILNSSKNNSSSNDTKTNIPDLNAILNSSTQNSESDKSEGNFQMPDMETMMKIMKLMNAMNSNVSSPSANLLYSLKPFLRDSKKDKVDKYVNFLKISSILSEINKSGGDDK